MADLKDILSIIMQAMEDEDFVLPIFGASCTNSLPPANGVEFIASALRASWAVTGQFARGQFTQKFEFFF